MAKNDKKKTNWRDKFKFAVTNDTTFEAVSYTHLSPKTYLSYLGNKLEGVVADVMTQTAKGTPFEDSIELISGQRFPDIIAKKYYGVEVKTSKQNHWFRCV